MRKRSLYARWWPLVTASTLILFGGTTRTARAQGSAAPPPCAACSVVVARPGQAILAAGPANGLEVVVEAAAGVTGDVAAAIEALAAAGARPGLLVRGPDTPLAGPALDAVSRVVIDLRGTSASGPDLIFALKTRLTELRGAGREMAIGVAGSAEQAGWLTGPDLAPYLDFVAVAGGPRPPYPAHADGLVHAAIHPAGVGPAAAGTPQRWLVELPVDVLLARNLLSDLAATARLLPEGLINGGTAEVRCGGTRADTFLDPESLDTVAVARGCGDGALSVVPEASGVTRVTLSSGDVVARVPAGEGRFAEGVQVRAGRTLDVREIIARHQAAAARQRRLVRTLISSGSMTLTFEAPGFPAPMAISSRAILYSDGEHLEIEQRDIRVNGVSFQGGGVPRLPLLEPERVAAPPLAITLNELYRYSLDGQERVDGVPCYVVRFEPGDPSQPLFAGRAWIAADSFALVKVSAVQTGLRGPIVASEQTDRFRREAEGVWLLARSDIRQTYEGAGHRTPIHRVLAVDRHEVNAPDFTARRAAAYASPSVMLRDTPEGYRYLRREPGVDGAGTVTAVVTRRATRVRTFAMGVIVDPNISTPLPFAGISYVDFDLFGTGTQLNGFFGGTYGQLAVSVPSLGGSRWQLAGRAFGLASSYNDRAFVEGREIYEANISQRPAHASAWLLRPLTSRVSFRSGYELDYTGFGAAGSTAPTFVVPASQLAHGIRVGVDAQWSGWSASAWWTGVRRAGWRSWGEPAGGQTRPSIEEYEPGHADFQRFGGLVSRSLVASPRLVGRVEAAWMGGRDLDRFSRYTFGSFDNRLRGYPSALIRYERGTVLRGSAAWAAGKLLRIDGFLDTAYVLDPGFGRRSRSYTGLGFAAEVPAPFGTLATIEWGYGFQGISADGRRGTQVVRISGYKIF